MRTRTKLTFRLVLLTNFIVSKRYKGFFQHLFSTSIIAKIALNTPKIPSSLEPTQSKSMENEHYGGSNEAFMTEITTIGGHKTKIIAMADVSYGSSKKDINSSGGSTNITNTSSTASNNLSTEELEENVTTETLEVLPNTSSTKEKLGMNQVKVEIFHDDVQKLVPF